MTQEEKFEEAKRLYETANADQRYVLESLFPELKESEDERIREALIKFFTLSDDNADYQCCGVHYKDIVAWLEKQGEQKSVYKVEPKFKVEKDKWYVCTSQYCNCIEGRNYKATSDGRIIDDYGTEYDMHSDAYQWFRPWTIQDAKDGDVLVSESNCGLDTWYCIFKSLDDAVSMTVHCYVGRDGRFQPMEELCSNKDPRSVKPATKEQRDLLFKKMKEAGYEWDAEKKELRKIEQKTADLKTKAGNWYICDKEVINENMLTAFHRDEIYYCPKDGYLDVGGALFEVGCLDVFRLATEKEIPQPKREWSDKDEKMIHHIENAIKYDKSRTYLNSKGIEIIDVCNWLKSLRPQSQWRPSDEQMTALSDISVTGCISYAGQGQELINLYNDLKKLREE